MIVPRYWAEGRIQHRQQGRQVTVRRFGWSDASQADAESKAQERAQAALQQILSGIKLPRRDPKVPYNGAEGLPIREEIVSRHGDVVVTRNAYGARCLNTPNVFFADLDFDTAVGCGVYLFVLVVLSSILVTAVLMARPTVFGAILAFGVAGGLTSFVVPAFVRLKRLVVGSPEQAALKRIRRFTARHPEWHLRVYRTPAGLRVLALHQLFAPSDPQVAEAFAELRTDPIYALMCRNQQCFRARVSPKPWRIGIARHLRPGGVWPISPERLPERTAWINEYEAAARGYAACSFIEEAGSGALHPEARFVQELHDEMCQANRSLLPIA